MLIDISGIGSVRLNWYIIKCERVCVLNCIHTILGNLTSMQVQMYRCLCCNAMPSAPAERVELLRRGFCLSGRKLIES